MFTISRQWWLFIVIRSDCASPSRTGAPASFFSVLIPNEPTMRSRCFRGRPNDADSRVINQISLRVESLDDLRVVYRRLIDARLKIDAVVNHVSALGCYYFDPEGNRSEVFWVTGRACWVPIAHLIDIEQPDKAVLAEIDALWKRLRHVGIGKRLANEPASLQLD